MFRICSFFLALVLAAPLWAGQPEIAGVPRVIDADTIDVAGQRIRLGGIDAPEMSETCLRADGRPWSCGRWATDRARAMLDGQRLRCIDLGERTHGRVVGRCYLNGQDIAIDLIEAGAARPCLRYARAQGQEAIYTYAEARALRARAGIYGGPLNPVARFCRLPGEQPVASGCEIKGNVSANGQIYHLPGQRHYESINMNKPGVRWFCSEEAAQAAGWRRAMR
ncbi:MAG: thermonuclease family protein [Rhodobacteraceae bacterium]|nr:MAG: thermonuclease family protein [Paracoccaceae bacterium]